VVVYDEEMSESQFFNRQGSGGCRSVVDVWFARAGYWEILEGYLFTRVCLGACNIIVKSLAGSSCLSLRGVIVDI
jgi:hypothetical protein